MTQPPQVWSEELKAMPWELDPSPENLRIWAGTAHYKLRPWWSNYTYSNYIPTCRAPFNPMQYVFRTTGLVRGAHSYGFVADDLKKDDSKHLYQWAAMLNGGVWQAEVPGLPPNQVVLAWRTGDPKLESGAVKPAITPETGDPLLLVCAVGLQADGDSSQPLAKVETAPGPADKKGNAQYFDRLMISRKDVSAAFRVLLIPFHSGGEIPDVRFDEASQTASIRWRDQVDEITFAPDGAHRSVVTIRRGGTEILSTTGLGESK
jgi:hypothetical protein